MRVCWLSTVIFTVSTGFCWLSTVVFT
jgi:hypothetical protein